jgi:type II secretory ATPase GspE/PulE/Tfp pilus assembly ATPase PilB-like protein
MHRYVSLRAPALFAVAVLLAALVPGELFAQGGWPALSAAAQADHSIARGPGFYLAIYKLVLLALLVFLWVKTTDWVGRDTREFGEGIGMPGDVWNSVVIFSFIIAFLVALLIPIFAASYSVLLLGYIAPLAVYIVQRNGKVTGDRKVLTPQHLKVMLSNLGKGGGKPQEMKQPWEMGPEVTLASVSKLQQQNQANMIEARQSAGFVPVKYLLADALDNRAEKIMLDYTADAVAIRYMIDGMWQNAAPKVHEKKPLDRELGDLMLAVLKKLASANPAERRAKQDGKLKVEFAGSKYDTSLVSQGTQTGERAVVTFVLITKTVRMLDDLGMRDKMREQLKELLANGQHGLMVVSSLPGDGLSATWTAMLKSTDRLMRDFVTIEAEGKQEADVENVSVVKYNPAAGESPDSVLPKVILKQPEVILVPSVPNGATLAILLEQIAENRLCFVSTRAKDAPDALLRLLALKPPVEAFGKAIHAVLYVRLIRKLCETCREAVPATPELLQKLGIPAGRVQTLYREKQPLQPGQEKKKGEPEICPNCRGLGYKGRTAIYELLVADDKVKQVLVKQPKAELIKQYARQAGNRSLQEEGILLVALGVTSLTELQRVLKQ